MDIFDVFSMNGIVNYPAAGEFFLENVILKFSQTLFQGFLSQGGAYIFQEAGGGGGGGGGGQCPPRGGCEVPCTLYSIITWKFFTRSLDGSDGKSNPQPFTLALTITLTLTLILTIKFTCFLIRDRISDQSVFTDNLSTKHFNRSPYFMWEDSKSSFKNSKYVYRI